MPYILDSNSFIQPKNTAYSFEVVPAYWEWLRESNRRGIVFSIKKVEAELLDYQDDLSKWVKKCDENFFIHADGDTAPHLKVVAQWVQDHASYTEAAKQKFYRGADYYLVAQARALGYTLVTFEKKENSVHRVKIPNVCDGVGVKYCNLYQMLKTEGAKF